MFAQGTFFKQFFLRKNIDDFSNLQLEIMQSINTNKF